MDTETHDKKICLSAGETYSDSSLPVHCRYGQKEIHKQRSKALIRLSRCTDADADLIPHCL